MHSQDPDKSRDAFFVEFDLILHEAESRNIDATFRGFVFPPASFRKRVFTPVCNFTETIFTGYANFYAVSFEKFVTFGGATFKDGANFSEAKFVREPSGSPARPNLDFQYVTLKKPEDVKFTNNDLGRALFFYTDVSKIDFGAIRWCERNFVRHDASEKEISNGSSPVTWAVSPKKGSRGDAIFEEFADGAVSHAARPPSNSPDEREYILIAKTYQQLKRNYDAQGDFHAAGDFHYGEMEMQRLHSRFHNRLLRRLSRTFSIPALYCWISQYGEDYIRPLILLAVAIPLFGALYPALGLSQLISKDTSVPVSYTAGQRLSSVLKGTTTSLQVTAFERDLSYTPSTASSRLLELSEHIVGGTLIGLAGLAIRRRFRRN
jgi:hypothetical protein